MNSIDISGNPNTFQLRFNENGYFYTVDRLMFIIEVSSGRARYVIEPRTKFKKVKVRRVRAMLIRQHLLDNRFSTDALAMSRSTVDDVYCLALRHDKVSKAAAALTRAWLYIKGMAMNWVLGYWL